MKISKIVVMLIFSFLFILFVSCVSSKSLIKENNFSKAKGSLKYEIVDSNWKTLEKGTVENGENYVSKEILFTILVLKKENSEIKAALIIQNEDTIGPMHTFSFQFYYNGTFYPGDKFTSPGDVYDKNGDPLSAKNKKNMSLWTASSFKINNSFFYNYQDPTIGRCIYYMVLKNEFKAKDPNTGITLRLLSGTDYYFTNYFN